jgi:hypothetical protein
LRAKILGLVALAAFLVVMGSIGLARNEARADALPTPLATVGANNVVSVSGFFNEDDSCTAPMPTGCSASVSVSPASAVTVALTFVRCDIDLNSNNSVADEAAAAGPAGNCVGISNASDTSTDPAVFTVDHAVVAGLDATVANTVNSLWRLNLQFTCNTLVSTNVTITYSQDGVISSTTITCTGTGGSPVIAIGKIDQNGGLRSAAFALGTPGFTESNILMSTSSTSAASNPCLSSASCTISPNTNVASGQFAPLSSGGVSLPTNTNIEIREISQSTNCYLVEIKLGPATSTTVMPLAYPVVARFDGASWEVFSNGVPFGRVNGNRLDLTYVNSCAQGGAAAAAGSSLAIVVGGASIGLSNTTHLEIIPAPGSDDDARLDIRIRDSNNVPLNRAHVTVLTDKGYLAMQPDTTSAPGNNPTGYDVIEPAAPNFGSRISGDTCDQLPFLSNDNVFNGAIFNPYFTGSPMVQDGFTNQDGIISACLYVSPDIVSGITPGRATITVIVENRYPENASFFAGGLYAPQNLLLTGTVAVVGPPASIRVAASPTSLLCGEKATITATITDSVGQNVSDHTRVELVSNYGSTIGGTGATLGFPGVGPVNPLSSSAAETFSGVATAFLLTSTEHVGPYEVVVASGGSVGGYFDPFFLETRGGSGARSTGELAFRSIQPGVFGQTGAFSTAPVSAQVTVTCTLPVVAAPVPSIPIPPIAAPRTGEGIRPPNTGDAGLADASGSSWALVLAGAAAFVLAGVVSVKFARR